MIEIIFTVYLSSMVLTWITGLLYYKFKVRKQIYGSQLSVLNQNLRKVNLFWSLKNSNFEIWTEDASLKDRQQFTRSLFLMIFIFSFLSFFGFVLLNLILFVGYSRKEARVFSSELALHSNLSSEQIREQVSFFEGF